MRRSSDPSGVFPVPLPPCPARLPPGSDQVRMAGLSAVRFPVYHPDPASCSVRFLFVSFMVRILGLFCRSVQFQFSFSLSSFVPLTSFPVRFAFILLSSFSVRFSFVPPSLFPPSSILFVLSLFSCVCLPVCVFLFIISRVYYTRYKGNFKCIFC